MKVIKEGEVYPGQQAHSHSRSFHCRWQVVLRGGDPCAYRHLIKKIIRGGESGKRRFLLSRSICGQSHCALEAHLSVPAKPPCPSCGLVLTPGPAGSSPSHTPCDGDSRSRCRCQHIQVGESVFTGVPRSPRLKFSSEHVPEYKT
jgi:hypothetical protein